MSGWLPITITVLSVLIVALGAADLWMGRRERQEQTAYQEAVIRAELRGQRAAMRVRMAAHQARQQLVVAAHEHDEDRDSSVPDEEWSA